jgi:hypothetical protein
VAAFDFRLFFVLAAVEFVAVIASLEAGLSAAAGFAVLSSAVVAVFLLFRDLFVVLAVVSAAADLSVAAGFAALSSAVVSAFLLLRDFFVVLAVVSVADLSVEAAAWSSAAFLAFFLDFLVVEEVLWASVELACALAKAGEITIVSIRQKQHIHRITLLWERFIFPRRRFKRRKAPFLRSIAL